MAVDMFINMGSKIKGESKDKVQGPKGDVEIHSWSFGMNQTGSSHLGGGSGAGKVSVSSLSIQKYVDKSSHALIQNCCTGTHIDKMVLLCRKAGEKQENYIIITLYQCLITSVGLGCAGDLASESVSIDFAKFTFDYWTQDDKGITKSAGEFTYDIAGNAKE